MRNDSDDYVTRIFDSPLEVDGAQWDALLAGQSEATPFMRHAYLAALHASGSATAATGWTPRWLTLWRGDALQAGCAMVLKDHSYGEYVFDWAWANAYAEHGLDYYPKALVAVPFTPVPGARLLAVDTRARDALVRALLADCRKHKRSSLHLLFLSDDDAAACDRAGLMARHTVQFHWINQAPTLGAAAPALSGGEAAPHADFDAFLASLSHDKRKKIRQERRKVEQAGVTFRALRGGEIGRAEWDFFYRCYERTYLEHGNAPYLKRAFFRAMERDMAQHWLLFVAERGGRPIACSLIALSDAGPSPEAAFGRYWGALERVDCLHFEACYYQPLQWCLQHGVGRFEGGAQGEHKMARALMPVKTRSAHWLAHPAFSDAVERFLEREGAGIAQYMEHLEQRSPFRQGKP
ncbi:MAG TPA: GNAT family N-acetyltransferase [Ramlibacter sp.]|nr:GNAT family N-acetyltransferase [Ramlibacter sp.]